ncbi:MAG: protein kinase [Acidobacteria bacterium]|nr:protein kinase [Acidobacteriota bacterium]
MIGQTISHYRILSKIGAGGMGEVYLAEDERLGRKLALKILPEQFTQDVDRVRRFEQEARAASALNHPNIITIYEIGRVNTGAGDLHFIATEFIEGETLRRLMMNPNMELSEALEIAIQCCNALQAAHNAGIAHRDIKPENIMLRPDGYIKILDFGLAKLTEQTTDLDAPTKSLLETQPGTVMGTVAYMSPEQARGQRVDSRTDVFSLGVVLYEMVSGCRPFGGATVSDVIAAVLVSEPKRLSQHLPNVPAGLEQIVARMLAKEREARYQSALEVLNDLKRIKSRVESLGENRETATLETPPTGPDISASTKAENMPTAPLYETNVGPQAELKIPPQTSYETNVVPAAQSAQTPPLSGAQTAMLPQGQAPRSRLRRFLLPALALIAVLLAAGLIALRFAARDAKIDSIAVLPFTVAGADMDAEYLSEGIAEGIINTLSQWPELSVSSRNSVIQYKGREANAQAVGRELEVEAALLGSIRRLGGNLVVNTELVDTSNGRQIWGESFNLKTSDLLAIQDRITRSISGKLQLRLGDSSAPMTASAGTKDSEAYDLYLKGRYYWNQGTPEAIAKADELFEAAVAKDPTYAMAAAGCAACHAAGSDGDRPQESMTKAKNVAMIALKADDTLVDAHLTLAQVNLRYDWNFADAEREFKRAIELNPKHATARRRYAEFLALMGRRREALDELNEARRLDPRSPPINTAFGTLAYYSRDYRDAIGHLRQTLEINKDFAPAHSALGLVYEQQGNTQDAVLEFLRAKIAMRADPEKTSALKKAYADHGREAFWREYLSQLNKEAEDRYVPQTAIAAVQLRLSENHKALAALEKAFEEKDGGLVELKVEPLFEPLRPSTKFSELLRRVGLAQ